MRRLVPFGIPLLVWGGLIGACSKENAAIDKGGECFFANECAPGLVCVAERDTGRRICTDDLSGVAGEPPDMGEEGDGAAGEGGEGGMTDGPVVIPDTGTDQSVGMDTGVVDTGVDTGQPVDAGDN